MKPTNRTEYGTTTIDCEISFTVSKMDYGTIMVPKGTKVKRSSLDGRFTEWSIAAPAQFCPSQYIIDGKVSGFYLHDAIHYGITIPSQNVRKLL